MNQSVRWTVRVSKDIDVAVRTFLAQRGIKKGSLARFIEEAVRWRVLDMTVAETKARNASVSVAKIGAAIEQALAAVHADERLRSIPMSTLTIRLPDAKHQRLKGLARSRGVSVNKLVEEWATVALAQQDAENRYRLRARRGRLAQGLALLDKLDRLSKRDPQPRS